MADNLKQLTQDVAAAINPAGAPGSILAVNHKSVLTQAIEKAGKYTGLPFVAKLQSTNGIIMPGTFVWNGNAMNQNGDFIITVSKYTSDMNDLGHYLSLLAEGTLIHFKDFVGRSVILKYKSHSADVDEISNDIFNILVSAVPDNTNYTYQLGEEEICIIEFFIKSNSSSLFRDVVLPTPQIAKRRINLGINPNPNPKSTTGPDFGWRAELDGITPRVYSYNDLNLVEFPENYYKEQFYIYFNSFGDRDWLNLPDLRLELCMVKNGKGAKKTSNITTTTLLEKSRNGNKDNYSNAIVHPANTSEIQPNIKITKYSGGNAGLNGVYSTNKYLFPTEWRLDKNNYKFSEDSVLGNGLNRLSNPNITIELDVRNFFKKFVTNPHDFVGLTYPHDLTQPNGSVIDVKNLGRIGFNGKYFKRNPVLFFRLSAGVVGSEIVGFNNKYIFLYGNMSTFAIYQDENIFISLGTGVEFSFQYNGINLINQIISIINNDYSDYKAYKNRAGDLIIFKKQYQEIQEDPYITNLESNETLHPDILRLASEETFYKERVYSDLSLPVYISLKLRKFFDDFNTYKYYIYGHKTTIGSK